MKSASFCLRVFGALLCAASAADATTRTVTNSQDDGTGSLRAAIAAAVDGDVIDFASTVQYVNLTTGPLVLDQRSLTIEGPGANALTIRRVRGTPRFRVITINGGTLAISGLTVANGRASGGGIFVANADLTLSRCAIVRNKGLSGAGVLSDGSTLTVKECTFSDNDANEGFGGGGGLQNNYSTVRIARTTFSRNSATAGGGILNAGLLTIINSTVAGNHAVQQGGGINKSRGRDGAPATVWMRNTIVAQNTAGVAAPDYSGRIVSGGYNLIGNSEGIISVHGNRTGNQHDVDPLLGPLQDNGGPTLTHALLPGSPAIDGGDAGRSTMDQRGFLRPVDFGDLPNATEGDGSDIGAVELQNGEW